MNKGGLDAALAEEIEAEVERLIGEGVVHDFQAVETEARRGALQLMGQGVAHRLNGDVGARLKHSGMRWTVDGANAIIALRCAVESYRFDDFRQRRAGAIP